MRVLVTGGAGFVGQWLARALLARGDAVFLTGLSDRFSGPEVLDADELGQVKWLKADVRDEHDIASALDIARPDLIFHLAGISFPPEADRSPALTYDVNVLGVVRLLTIVAAQRAAGTIDPRIIVVGSGVQYGIHQPGDIPLVEEMPQRPVSVYAASKAAQEVAALQAHRASGLAVVCTRSFNHSRVGHASEYLLPSLVARARNAAARGGASFRLGNDVVRDYLHISDVIRAYLLLAERGVPGEAYNVASGHGVGTYELARDVLLRVGTTADISTDPSLVRTTDIPTLVGSPEKLRRDTGWSPEKTHLDIIDDLIRSAERHAATH